MHSTCLTCLFSSKLGVSGPVCSNCQRWGNQLVQYSPDPGSPAMDTACRSSPLTCLILSSTSSDESSDKQAPPKIGKGTLHRRTCPCFLNSSSGHQKRLDNCPNRLSPHPQHKTKDDSIVKDLPRLPQKEPLVSLIFQNQNCLRCVATATYTETS